MCGVFIGYAVLTRPIPLVFQFESARNITSNVFVALPEQSNPIVLLKLK